MMRTMRSFGNTFRCWPWALAASVWGCVVGAALLVPLQTPLAAWYVTVGEAGPAGYAASWA